MLSAYILQWPTKRLNIDSKTKHNHKVIYDTKVHLRLQKHQFSLINTPHIYTTLLLINPPPPLQVDITWCSCPSVYLPVCIVCDLKRVAHTPATWPWPVAQWLPPSVSHIHVSSTMKTAPPLPREIYVCSGGLRTAFINVPHLLYKMRNRSN